MIKEEIFQVYQEIIQKLEAQGFKILEGADLVCKIDWQGWQIFVSFQNILARIRQEPDEKDSLISGFIQKISNQLQSKQASTARFWPRILPFVDEKSLSAPWSQSLVPKKLEVGFVEEGEHSLRFLQPFQMISRGLSLQTLKKESFDNLEWAFEQLEWHSFEEGIWGVEDENGLSSAMLLLLGRKFPMKHEKIAIPTRNHLWICSDYNKLPFFELRVKQVYQNFPYPILGEVFSWAPLFDQFYADLG